MSYDETVKLLRELQVLGFTDEAYVLLAAPNDSLAAHLAHASKTETLDAYGDAIQRRLRLVRDSYIKAAFRSGSTGVFKGLATAARAEIPG